jgi:hypothetical protein
MWEDSFIKAFKVTRAARPGAPNAKCRQILPKTAKALIIRSDIEIQAIKITASISFGLFGV